MADDWLNMTMAELGKGIDSGEIEPVLLTEAYLTAINESPQKDRIYARLTEDRALAEAEAASARAKAKQRRGLLDGVPISWKDLYDTAGVATEAGSALLKGRTPDRDAVVLQNATAAGLVCLGKTHMSELAFSGLGYNPVTQTSPCVNDLEAVAGGSSSGAAASVAFGLAACGIGSDTGGSVRIPAVWNDLVGLKTTSGLLSLDGVVPLAKRFDTVGPLCRSVEDAALMLGALGGTSPCDLRGATLQGTKMMVLRTVAMDDVRDAPIVGFESAVQRLQAAGAEVHYADVDGVADAMDLSGVLYTTEAYAQWGEEIEAAPDLMFDKVRDRFQAGAEYSGIDYIRAWDRLESCRKRFFAGIAGYDAVLMPTCPTLPPNVERLRTDDAYFVSENLMALRNTRIGNLMGTPALTLPTGVPSTGLMMLTPPNTEARLLRLGAAAEAALA
ncbi:amidase [Aliiroseovarius sp. YM-037]|uniref:amidase n=1 Tax=Aliiroseovarius sp. YM-037 TaxID=3341728 RepID=UPI003A80C42B